MAETHQCKSMESGDAWISEEKGSWLLNINHLATEQDLEENSYLEEAGQIIDNVAIEILYCPYCGERLDQMKSSMIPEFYFHDFSKW